MAALFRLVVNMLRGVLGGFCSLSRIDVDQLILQRLPLMIAVIVPLEPWRWRSAPPKGVLLRRALTLVRSVSSSMLALHRDPAADLLDPARARSIWVLIHLGGRPSPPCSTRPRPAPWWGGVVRQSIMLVVVLGSFQAGSWNAAMPPGWSSVIGRRCHTERKACWIALLCSSMWCGNVMIWVVMLVVLEMGRCSGAPSSTEQIFGSRHRARRLIDAIRATRRRSSWW